MTSAAPPPEHPMVLWELVQTARLAERAFRTLFADAQLKPTQFGILACLADGDDFTKTQLAQALMVRPQSIDPLVEDLIAQELVIRDGPPRRGRAAGITITAAGLARLGQVRPRVAAVNDPRELGLDPDAVPELVSQLRAIRDRLES